MDMLRLTVRTLANGFVALVDDNGQVAKLLRPTSELVGSCCWAVEVRGHAGACVDDEDGECVRCLPFQDGPRIEYCDAVSVYGDDGWRCESGHSHFSNVEYYDDDEVAAARLGRFAFAGSAAKADGTPLA